MDIILEIEDLSKYFTIDKKKKKTENKALFSHFYFKLPKGKITTLIGSNGVGKTTLFNIISGFIDAERGVIKSYIDEEVVLNALKPYKREHLGIGRMFQDDHILNHLTIMENLKIAGKDIYAEDILSPIFRRKNLLDNEHKIELRIKNKLLEIFGDDDILISKLDRYARDLSYGQKRILALVKVLLKGYKILLIDEPTSGVNPVLFRKMINIIKNESIMNGTTVFMIEHNMEFVHMASNYCAYLEDGRIKNFGTPKEVLGSKTVKESYLGFKYVESN